MSFPFRSVPIRQIVAGLLLAGLLPNGASAHPHVWVKVQSEFLFGPDQRMTGIRHRWTFDEFYTAMAVQGLDKNGDGAYDRAELKELADLNVQSLNEFDYFTFLKSGQTDVALKDPVDYWLEHRGNVLTLHFTLPLAEPLAATVVPLRLDVYDPSFYVSFSFAGDLPVAVAQGAPPSCRARIAKPDPDTEADTDRLKEAFLSQLGADGVLGEVATQTAELACAAS